MCGVGVDARAVPGIAPAGGPGPAPPAAGRARWTPRPPRRPDRGTARRAPRGGCRSGRAAGPRPGSGTARRRAGAQRQAMGRVAEVAAGTGVHGRREHETCRKGEAHGGPAQRDDAVLQRLAQHLEHVPAELGQLVQEQHAAVGQADLAGARDRPAADQAGVADGVVRRPEGAQDAEGPAGRRACRRRCGSWWSRAPRRGSWRAGWWAGGGPAWSCRRPGGPMSRRLWPPAAATSSARLAAAWLRTSAKSTSSRPPLRHQGRQVDGGRGQGGIARRGTRRPRRACGHRGPRGLSTTAASGTLSAGTRRRAAAGRSGRPGPSRGLRGRDGGRPRARPRRRP